MKFEQAKILSEDFNIIKFFYQRFKHDPNPHIAVLDQHYCYDNGKKVDKDDVLGYNMDYAGKGDDPERAINDLSSFSHMLDKRVENGDGKDLYERIRDLYPKSLKFIRRYKKDAMTDIKLKSKDGWKKISIDDLKEPEY